MANTGNTLLALVSGAAIGAVVGILYAPDSGEKTRKKIKKETEKAQDQFAKKYQETTSNLTSKARQARLDFEARLEDTLSSASYKADEILGALESKLEELRKQNARLQKEVKSETTSTGKAKKATA